MSPKGWHGESDRHSEVQKKRYQNMEKDVKKSTTVVDPIKLNEAREYNEDKYGLEKDQRKAIEEELGCKVVDSTPDSRGNSIKLEDDSEYLIYNSEEEAEDSAKDYVRQMLEDEPELFDNNWLKQHTSLSDTDRRMIAQDMSDNYASDIRDEDDGKRLIDEADMEEKYGELEDKLDRGTYNEDQFEVEKERLLDKAEEKLRNEMYDDHYDRLSDPHQYFVEDEGIYTTEEFFKQYPSAININEAAEEAVRIDGIAHFLASWDGQTVYFKDGSVGYRTN